MRLQLVPSVLLAGLFGLAAGQVHTCEKGIALTFDDGPNTLTRDVIDALTADRHFATFFINVNNYGAWRACRVPLRVPAIPHLSSSCTH